MYLNKGISLYSLGKYTEAIDNYNKAISFRPNFSEAYSNRGASLYKLNEYDKAIESYDKAIEISPKYVDAYMSKAVCLKNRGKYDEAIATYDKAIEKKGGPGADAVKTMIDGIKKGCEMVLESKK